MAAEETKQVTFNLLLPPFTNEMFKENLSFLKMNHPGIYNSVVDYTPSRYALCSNPDGSPNIMDLTQRQPVYKFLDYQSLIHSIQQQIDSLPLSTNICGSYFTGGDEIYKANNEIQSSLIQQLYEVGSLKQLKISSQNLPPLRSLNSTYIPFIRVTGIGLGFHLTELLKKKTITYMTIYEPDPDLFFSSLYTIPWKIIFGYFSTGSRDINLVIGGSAQSALENNLRFIKSKFLAITSFYYRFNHMNNPQIKELIKLEHHSDIVERSESDGGWYEDQKQGLYFSSRNVLDKNYFYTGRKLKNYTRAFLVGAGPSLNDSIDYLQKNQDKAIIISCGSAITPLLNAGIMPDYEVIQERVWHLEKHEQKHDLEKLKQISLFKLNVVSTKVDQFYDKSFVFQKFRDPGSSLLKENYPVTTGLNPTVTNSGIAICSELGFHEIYLFGVDYGAPAGTEKMHADNTIYDDEEIDDNVETQTNLEIEGNLGSVIKTTSILAWSKNIAEEKILENRKAKWFNVGEGAKIAGATPVTASKTPRKFKKKCNKIKVNKEIAHCFDNSYNQEETIEQLKTGKMKDVREYLDVLTQFSSSKPKTREEIVNVLYLLYTAVKTGTHESQYLPSSLLPYGFIQFITNVYIQSSLQHDDKSASLFFEKAMEILEKYIAAINKDLAELMNFIDDDEEKEIVKVWYNTQELV